MNDVDDNAVADVIRASEKYRAEEVASIQAHMRTMLVALSGARDSRSFSLFAQLSVEELRFKILNLIKEYESEELIGKGDRRGILYLCGSSSPPDASTGKHPLLSQYLPPRKAALYFSKIDSKLKEHLSHYSPPISLNESLPTRLIDMQKRLFRLKYLMIPAKQNLLEELNQKILLAKGKALSIVSFYDKCNNEPFLKAALNSLLGSISLSPSSTLEDSTSHSHAAFPRPSLPRNPEIMQADLKRLLNPSGLDGSMLKRREAVHGWIVALREEQENELLSSLIKADLEKALEEDRASSSPDAEKKLRDYYARNRSQILSLASTHKDAEGMILTERDRDEELAMHDYLLFKELLHDSSKFTAQERSSLLEKLSSKLGVPNTLIASNDLNMMDISILHEISIALERRRKENAMLSFMKMKPKSILKQDLRIEARVKKGLSPFLSESEHAMLGWNSDDSDNQSPHASGNEDDTGDRSHQARRKGLKESKMQVPGHRIVNYYERQEHTVADINATVDRLEQFVVAQEKLFKEYSKQKSIESNN